MSILVVCPGCRKSFKVSEKFAGKSGPCPKCKATIRIPEKSEAVQIHAPEEFAGGGRSREGKLVTKPIARTDARFDPVKAAIIGGASLVVVATAFVGGRTGLLAGSMLARAVAVLVISPPLVVAAYSFLRDDELEPYRGMALYVRAAICAVAYTVLWGVFGYVAANFMTGELWNWLVVAPPLLCIGALAAYASLDLEFGSAFFHYAFYILVTIGLRAVAGLEPIWHSAGSPLG
jgi:hypothetical protein